MLSYWLPLNGNLNNNGLSSLSPIPSATLAYNDSGKIGKCFQSGSQYISLPLENVPTAISICFWVKPNSPGSWRDIFSLGNSNNRLEVTTTTSYCWYCNENYHQLIQNGIYVFDLDNAIWNHICMTADGTTVKFYINGSLVKTFSQISSFSDIFGDNLKINIGSRIDGSMLYSGYINDFRVYTDEVISLKQLQHIKSALVCHYPLKSQYETGQVNKYSGDVAEGSLNGSGFSKTKLVDERGYNYKLSYTGTGSATWSSIRAGYFSFTVGKKYYYSCKVRCHSKNVNLYLRASRSINDWVTNMTNVLNPDGEWHEYVVYQTINETYDRSGSTVTCNPVLEIYTDALSTSGEVYSADFDIKDIQVIESDCYVPFIDNSMASTVVSDCSGYGNDGTANGVIAWSDNSPRYSGSYVPTTNSSYISTILNTSGYANSYTFSYWAKISDMSSKMAFGFSDGNRLNLYPTNSIFCWNTGDAADNPFKNNGTNVTFTSYNGAWHHYTVTGDGTTTTLYIDGEKKGVARIYRSITGTKLFLSGWDNGTSYRWTGGNISDFRLYSTCFSESDVKSLYQVSASIDKTGILSCYEFCEEE